MASEELSLFGDAAPPADDAEPPTVPSTEPVPTADVEADVEADGGSTGTPVGDRVRPGGGDDDAPSSDEPRVWSVSQINRAVKRLLESQIESLWISGEVANWKRASSGHCYFTLKDDTAQIRVVMWRTDASRLPTDPEDGMEVRVRGQLTLYERRGEFQLQARDIEAEGAEGLWQKAFDELKQKLDAEGLLDPALRRPLPAYPEVVGVVTSTTGAALRDILSVLSRRAPWVRVVVAGARVQGEGAEDEVAAALEHLVRSASPDVVIVGRGGGSIEDLWAFNREAVARAVAACPVPVVSAVGHETDVTICDLVADVRAPTPSAGAEAVVPDGAQLRRTLRALPERLGRALRAGLDRRTEAVRTGPGRLARAVTRRVGPLNERLRGARTRAARGIERVLRSRTERADRLERLHRGIRGRIDGVSRDLRGLSGRLDALSPLATMRRGYAVPLDEEGRVLRGTEDFTEGTPFVLRVADGRVHARTTNIEPAGEAE